MWLRERLLTVALALSVSVSVAGWLGRSAEAQPPSCGRYQVVAGTIHPPQGVPSVLILKVDTETGATWQLSYQPVVSSIKYQWTPIP
jgi:hypothetical protein